MQNYAAIESILLRSDKTLDKFFTIAITSKSQNDPSEKFLTNAIRSLSIGINVKTKSWADHANIYDDNTLNKVSGLSLTLISSTIQLLLT